MILWSFWQSTEAVMKPASWIIRNREAGRVLFETYEPEYVRCLNTAKYEAVPILKYLQEISARIRAAGGVA